MCHRNALWTRILPTVLLGLRTTYREDFKTSSAELVYGEQLRIPSQFLSESKQMSNQVEFAKELRTHFESVRPAPPSRHCANNTFIFKELNHCTHVFVRTDALRKSLQPPYEGPFPVITRKEKAFLIHYRGKQCNISIDRLKPCFMEDNVEQNMANDVQTDTASTEQNTATTNKRQVHIQINNPSADKSNNVHKSEQDINQNPSLTITRTGRHIKPPARYKHRELHTIH